MGFTFRGDEQTCSTVLDEDLRHHVVTDRDSVNWVCFTGLRDGSELGAFLLHAAPSECSRSRHGTDRKPPLRVITRKASVAPKVDNGNILQLSEESVRQTPRVQRKSWSPWHLFSTGKKSAPTLEVYMEDGYDV